MRTFSLVREVINRVGLYLVFGGIFFPAWFFWNVKEVEFIYVGGYLMHFTGGLGGGLLATVMVIVAGNLKVITRRFYFVIFPSVFVWMTGMEFMQWSQPWRSFQWEDILTQTLGLMGALGLVRWKEGPALSPKLRLQAAE